MFFVIVNGVKLYYWIDCVVCDDVLWFVFLNLFGVDLQMWVLQICLFMQYFNILCYDMCGYGYFDVLVGLYMIE